ncbi:hypothetical protein BMS3Abin07_01072 [bacterium BMS3Abin07]|nr:hypothetical protein BMS3Abin07_01072 [bacterium BMS3Abin07]GBE31934.1 hypothetical protein BMS3Bbin05_00839 [bacterium BMS3Bbin05]
MSLFNSTTTREEISRIISILLESSFYLEMELQERLNLVKVMMSSTHPEAF